MGKVTKSDLNLRVLGILGGVNVLEEWTQVQEGWNKL